MAEMGSLDHVCSRHLFDKRYLDDDAVAAKLSAARPAQDEMLRLDTLAAEGYWGILISPNASLAPGAGLAGKPMGAQT
jgi:hypothetical protein